MDGEPGMASGGSYYGESKLRKKVPDSRRPAGNEPLETRPPGVPIHYWWFSNSLLVVFLTQHPLGSKGDV